MNKISDKLVDMLVKYGKLTIDDMKAAKMLEIQEVLMNNSIVTPKITERQKGGVTQYYCVLPTRYSRDGKRHQIICNTKEEVEQRFQQAAYDAITEADADNITVANVMEKWLKSRKDGVKGQTQSGYYGYYENHVKNSAFGKTRIADVRLPECQEFINSLYKKELSKSTMSHIKSAMSMVFEYAVAHDIILRNYFSYVKINPNLCSTKRTHETDAWTDEEILQLWDASEKFWKTRCKYRFSAVLMFQIFSGVRIGELVEATWDDVDFEHKKFHISKTHAQYKDYETGMMVRESSTPKTENSRRIIELNDAALYWLKEMKHRNDVKGIDSKFICASYRNTLIPQPDMAKRYRIFCHAANLPYKPSHSGRKSYVTMMYEKGITLADISSDVGHKYHTTTANIYLKERHKKESTLCQKNAAILATVGNRLQTSETAQNQGKTA